MPNPAIQSTHTPNAPTDQGATEKIKLAPQMGVDWVIAEYDKLSHLGEAITKSANEAMDTLVSGGDFEFDDMAGETATEDTAAAATDVEDAPIVKFLH